MRWIAARALAAVGLLTLRSGFAAVEPQAEVVVRSLAFTPAIIRVRIGTEIVFRNEESATSADDSFHSVVAEDGSFNSQQFGPGQVFSLRPTKPGKLRYFCGVHPFMTGEINVTR